jgi:Leucine-rich repeat (LRR) protein
MKKTAICLGVAFLVGMFVACSSGPPPQNPGGGGGPGDPVGPGAQNKQAGDPAEQKAITTVNTHGGWVKQDDAQPNRPVIEVSLFKDSVTDDTLQDLASLKKARKIKLTQTKITAAGLRHLAGLKDLTELSLSGSGVDDAGLKEIAALTGLKSLNIQGAKISDAALRSLAPLTQLEELSVEGTLSGIGDSAGLTIADSLKQLKTLNIGNNPIGDIGFTEIASKLGNLRSLTLWGTRITHKGHAALPKLTQLEEIRLNHPDVTDQTMKYLAQCKNLRSVSLSSTAVTDKGLQELGTLPNLRELELGGNGAISSAAVEQFMRAHPKCSVRNR